MAESSPQDTILSVIPGETPETRMVFATRTGDHDRPIVLRQESFSEGVGWFVQSQIEMTRFEMSQLRTMLGGRKHQACERTTNKILSESEPVILRFRGVSAAS